MTTGSFVTEIDLKLASKLKEDLAGQGFVLSKPPYTIFGAKKEGVSCTLYASGKLMVQGKGKDEFIRYYLEPEILLSLQYSHPEVAIMQSCDKHAHIGIDESGKGDYFGPLCIAGLYADEAGIETLVKMGIKDSKKLDDRMIRTLAAKLKAAFTYKVIALFPTKYNELYDNFRNLNTLLAWGHATTIEDLVTRSSCTHVTIDQFAAKHVVERALAQKKLTLHLTQRHRGEEDPVVAAASILARNAFIEGIDLLSKEYDLTLPKGASAAVKRAKADFLTRHTQARLPAVAKMHFKV